MKHLILFIYSLLLLPMAGNAQTQSENLPLYDNAQAEAIMSQYFAALASGDVAIPYRIVSEATSLAD